MIERLRLVAMLEIVAFHMFGPLPLLDGLGLPVFLLLSIAFSVATGNKHDLKKITYGRLRGIGLPWLYWSGIYALFVSILAIRHGTPLSEVFNPLMILYGTSLHLWFCPFIILAGVITAGIHRWTRGHSSYWKFGLTIMFALICLMVVSSEDLLTRLDARNFPNPFWQWYFSSPSILLGLALGQAFLLYREDPRWMDGVAAITLLIAFASIVYLTPDHLFRRYMVSFAVIATTFALGHRIPNRGQLTVYLSSMMLGVYLIHIIIGHLFHKLLSDYHLLYTAVVFALSVWMVAVIRKTRLRWLFGS
jgi:hypothetical protein